MKALHSRAVSFFFRDASVTRRPRSFQRFNFWLIHESFSCALIRHLTTRILENLRCINVQYGTMKTLELDLAKIQHDYRTLSFLVCSSQGSSSHNPGTRHGGRTPAEHAPMTADLFGMTVTAHARRPMCNCGIGYTRCLIGSLGRSAT